MLFCSTMGHLFGIVAADVLSIIAGTPRLLGYIAYEQFFLTFNVQENTMRYLVTPSSLHGSGTVPSSKSHTMRAVLFASFAKGQSIIHNVLPSPDAAAMVAACRALGAVITEQGTTLTIQGVGGCPQPPQSVIDVGNSGQVLRFVAALAALMPYYTVLTGDKSICTIRPMQPLLEGLTQAGAFAVSTKDDGKAPIVVRGLARAAALEIDGSDSQPVSALLMLAAFLEGTTTITVRNPGEKPWIGLTLHWLDMFGVRYTNDNFCKYTVTGPTVFNGFTYTVPADWSSAAFPIAAALVTRSEMTLENVDFADPQGDKGVVDALEKMGASFTREHGAKRLQVHGGVALHGAELDVNTIIDAVPVLAAVACYASSPTTITGAAIARQKESDRLHAIATELGKMGARIEERPDGLVIHPAALHGAHTTSYHDHRIAMACAVAGLGASSPTTVHDVACVAKSFPGFAGIMQGLGASVVEVAGEDA